MELMQLAVVFPTVLTCLVVQMSAIWMLSQANSLESELTGLLVCVIGIWVIISNIEASRLRTSVIDTPALVMLCSAITLGLGLDRWPSVELLGGIWVLGSTLCIAQYSLLRQPQRMKGVQLAVFLGFVVVTVLPIMLSPLVAITDSAVLATVLIAINPICFLAGLTSFDLFYSPWIYSNTPYSDIRIDGVHPLVTATIYSGAAVACLTAHHIKKPSWSSTRTNL